MSDDEKAEHTHLINLWNCTEPMTPAQLERMRELDEITKTETSP